MTEKGKPSETAFFAAFRRDLAFREFKGSKMGPDNLAQWFLPPHFRFFLKFKKIQTNTKEKLSTPLPGLTEYMIARTAYFDELFVEALGDALPQIVCLGAGYDTRPYRFSEQNTGTRIFELDEAATQDRKRKCLRKAGIEVPDEVSFVPIDFNQESLKSVLNEAGYRKDLKTLFVWEGVSYYLDSEAVDAMLSFVRDESHPDSAIAFDYTVVVPEEKIDSYYGLREFSQTMKDRHADEALTFSIEEDGIESFLRERGMAVINHLNNREIEKKYLVDDGGSLIGEMTAHFRFVLVSVLKA